MMTGSGARVHPSEQGDIVMMKQMVSLIGVMAIFAAVQTVSADDWAQGNYRSSGTYVQPYCGSHADGSFNNNWSANPDSNPFKAQKGIRHTPSYEGYHDISYRHYNSTSYRSYTPGNSAWSGHRKW
jgi:hypothetical protein